MKPKMILAIIFTFVSGWNLLIGSLSILVNDLNPVIWWRAIMAFNMIFGIPVAIYWIREAKL